MVILVLNRRNIEEPVQFVTLHFLDEADLAESVLSLEELWSETGEFFFVTEFHASYDLHCVDIMLSNLECYFYHDLKYVGLTPLLVRNAELARIVSLCLQQTKHGLCLIFERSITKEEAEADEGYARI